MGNLILTNLEIILTHISMENSKLGAMKSLNSPDVRANSHRHIHAVDNCFQFSLPDVTGTDNENEKFPNPSDLYENVPWYVDLYRFIFLCQMCDNKPRNLETRVRVPNQNAEKIESSVNKAKIEFSKKDLH